MIIAPPLDQVTPSYSSVQVTAAEPDPAKANVAVLVPTPPRPDLAVIIAPPAVQTLVTELPEAILGIEVLFKLPSFPIIALPDATDPE